MAGKPGFVHRGGSRERCGTVCPDKVLPSRMRGEVEAAGVISGLVQTNASWACASCLLGLIAKRGCASFTSSGGSSFNDNINNICTSHRGIDATLTAMLPPRGAVLLRSI